MFVINFKKKRKTILNRNSVEDAIASPNKPKKKTWCEDTDINTKMERDGAEEMKRHIFSFFNYK